MFRVPLFFNRSRRVYLDHAGAAPVRGAALAAFAKAAALPGNPGALHAEAVEAKGALESARGAIARELGVKAREIVFTSGGTEGNNLAILGSLRHLQQGAVPISSTHWIVSAIEHPSVLECFDMIRDAGGAVTLVHPGKSGAIDVASFTRELRKETVFVSIGWANGEIGTVQPLAKIAHAIRAHENAHGTSIVFHADAGQAPLYLSPQAHTLGVDLLVIDGGKLGSPRGAGALFVREGVRIEAIMHGGAQESGLRPGTENVALASGLAAALTEASEERDVEAARLDALREKLLAAILHEPSLSSAIVNGTGKRQLPHLLNISIPGVDNEYLTLALDRAWFAVATKSACKEGERASAIVQALSDASDAWRATTALRISMGADTRERDIEAFIPVLAQLADRSREVQGS